jgi:hypothetical protein
MIFEQLAGNIVMMENASAVTFFVVTVGRPNAIPHGTVLGGNHRMSHRRSQASPCTGPRHPVAVWLVLGAVFGLSAGVNLFLAAIDTQVWPFVLGFGLVVVALCCGFMAWREHRERY